MDGPTAVFYIVTLIFGGCCTNVFALEAILQTHSDSGLLITFTQFVLAALASSLTQLSSRNGLFRAPIVPLWRWAIIATMFALVNLLNNWAFAFHISVPVHIVLRSFGSVSTMAAGWLRGKRYSRLQVFSVFVLTLGVGLSAFADAEQKGKDIDVDIHLFDSKTSAADQLVFIQGLTVLVAAQLLSAFMGTYVQDTYAAYPQTHWSENLFYSHLLSLPLFIPLQPELKRQWSGLLTTLPLSTHAIAPFLPSWSSLTRIPSGIALLIINSITQLACITGVNVLSARSTAVTVTIVLNVRKLVSFLFSIYLFGNTLSPKMSLGAALVFGAGALYGFDTARGKGRKSSSTTATKVEKRGEGVENGTAKQ